jgi:hypothetical protein
MQILLGSCFKRHLGEVCKGSVTIASWSVGREEVGSVIVQHPGGSSSIVVSRYIRPSIACISSHLSLERRLFERVDASLA